MKTRDRHRVWMTDQLVDLVGYRVQLLCQYKALQNCSELAQGTWSEDQVTGLWMLLCPMLFCVLVKLLVTLSLVRMWMRKWDAGLGWLIFSTKVPSKHNQLSYTITSALAAWLLPLWTPPHSLLYSFTISQLFTEKQNTHSLIPHSFTHHCASSTGPLILFTKHR